jgi:RHS repeat-associated protein
MKYRLLFISAFFALTVASASAGRFVPADAPAAGLGRYRVALDTTRIDDPDAAVTQLLSICRCRIEPYAEEGFTGFLVSATPSAARMLSSDPRVSVVEELVSEAAAPTAAPAVIPSAERETWAGGEAVTAPRTEPVATAALHIPESNAGITAWDTGTYTYDGSGNIRSIGTTQIYTYDLYGRLAYAKVQASRFQRFSYDRFGNLLNTTTNNDTPPAPQTISGVSNRLSSGGATYDAAGRMLTGTGVAFRYDGDGMPTWSQMAAGSVTQTKVQIYSATDERIASLWIGPANGSDWTIRDAGGQVLRRLHKSTSGQWSWQEDYVYRDGQMLASEVATREKTLHYHLDHLGTPRLITGNGGAQVALHTYDPFGAEVTVAGQTGTEPIKKFTGHERDTANVDYMHARYYQNGWGRFLSVDPTWDSADRVRPQSWNRYSYVRNSPVNRTDPDGRVDGNGMGEPLDWESPGLDRAQQLEVSNRTAKGTAIGTLVSLAIVAGPSGWRALATAGMNWMRGNPGAVQQAMDLAEGMAGPPSGGVNISAGQLQSKFKHAGDFGVSGNFNLANAAAFGEAIQKHVQSKGTVAIQGAYRSAKNLVTYHLDSATSRVVITDRGGNFVTAYKASVKQVEEIVTKGWGF